MADIVSTDLTVTQVSSVIVGRTRRNELTLVFGNGTLTYPANGIPLTLAQLGLKRDIKALHIVDPSNADGYVYKWDKSNNKIRVYTQGVVVGAAGAVTTDDFPVTASAGTDAALSLQLTNSAGAGTHRWGDLKELVGGSAAPAATTLKVIVEGW